jgi:hypothetical protein
MNCNQNMQNIKERNWNVGVLQSHVIYFVILCEYCDVHAVGQQSTVEKLVYKRC